MLQDSQHNQTGSSAHLFMADTADILPACRPIWNSRCIYRYTISRRFIVSMVDVYGQRATHALVRPKQLNTPSSILGQVH